MCALPVIGLLPAARRSLTVTYIVTGSRSAQRLAVVSLFLVLAGCGGDSLSNAPPAKLVYAINPVIYTRGKAIPPDKPSNSGGIVQSYAIKPGLPLGLLLDPRTGVISGTPEELLPAMDFTVTGRNSHGSTTARLNVTVVDQPPQMLTYSANPVVYITGKPIPPDTPSNEGGAAVSYAVAPPLPAGLALDTNTGVISGAPQVRSPASQYTVTATNSAGWTSCILTITVNDGPPLGLSYATNPAVYFVGESIADNLPTSGGGAPASYAITPALPPGLNIDSTTGIISGTPTALAPTALYKVTATNDSGYANATLTITVDEAQPVGLMYSMNPATYTRGLPIPNNVPSVGGGAVVSWSIVPALPAGLAFDGTSGVISGTPVALQAATNYLVTATNSGGSTQVSLTIAVIDLAPMGLTYASNPASYSKGQTITPNVPSFTGGAPSSYTITPALPAGLTLNATTGSSPALRSAPLRRPTTR
jgi:hypothetical protein